MRSSVGSLDMVGRTVGCSARRICGCICRYDHAIDRHDKWNRYAIRLAEWYLQCFLLTLRERSQAMSHLYIPMHPQGLDILTLLPDSKQRPL